MNIYLFSQALDNKSEDDWVEVENQKLIRIREEKKTASLNNKIFLHCSKPAILSENDLKIYHSMNPDQSNNAVLIVDLNDKDVKGRRNLITVFIESFHDHDLNINFGTMLSDFKSLTGRTGQSNGTSIEKMNSTIKTAIKKKAIKKKSSLALICLISILVLVMLVIGIKQ